ncbi:MAG: cell division protein FtsA [Buchnera aphidicola (Nurudea shiraii)]
MIKEKNRKLIVGLEIGTTKIITLIGEIVTDGIINVVGIGICPSLGIIKGIINDFKSVVKCIKKSIHQAENMADYHVSSVYLAISNKYISCQNEVGIVPISKHEVTIQDVKNVIHTAKCVRIRNKHHILHIIPQEYSIDHHVGIHNPIGLSGKRIKTRVHLITCLTEVKKNILKAVETCGIKVNRVIFSGLASSQAVLTKDEQKLGVCMADIGGGTIDISMYVNGTLQYSCVIPYAGNSVTNDIAYALNIPFKKAEIIKIQYGLAEIPSSQNIHKKIEIAQIDNKSVKTFEQCSLIKIIELRYTELLNLINKEILNIQDKLQESKNYYKLGAGIVFTGGASKIKLLTQNAKKIFNMPIRIGRPEKNGNVVNNIEKSNYSTAVGLLYYGKQHYQNYKKNKMSKNIFKKWFNSFNNWIKKAL